MAINEFINIDGDSNTKTPWISEAHGITYQELGYTDGYQLHYTQITKEIPTIIGQHESLTDEEYWSTEPALYAKLSIHRTFTTAFLYYIPRFFVFHNGILLDQALLSHTGYGRFEIDESVPDGYIWVQYTSASPAFCTGDKRSEINRPKVISELVSPPITKKHIIRCRQAITNLALHTGYTPHNWIGGPHNSIRSQATNIIETITPIYGEHIIEMQDVLTHLAQHIDSLSAAHVPCPVFTTVVCGDPYSIHYINELRLAINTLEYYVIDLVT